ncbi:MAG: hypothetical protein CSA47_00240 [Gammaproteobacteria bacterium]|nr:MAG: hypothetical protein CSA47_00240 [Gammaproteobacteria bacterium]
MGGGSDSRGLDGLLLAREAPPANATSNVLERLNKEIKRRTRVATLFPNEDACLRLVSAVLMEISEEWQTGKVYLNMQE